MDASQAPRARGTCFLSARDITTVRSKHTAAHDRCPPSLRRPQRLYWGHGLAAPASRPSGDSRRSWLFLPKELPGLLAEPPECFLPASPNLLALEAPPLCHPRLGPWAPSCLDFGCKSTSLFWTPGHSARDCVVPGAQLAIGLRPSYLQDPPSPTTPCGLRWLLQLPT